MDSEDQKGKLKIPFFRLGAWVHPKYGPINGTQEMFNQMVQNFNQHVLGRPVFIRLGHSTAAAPVFGNVPAEAWVTDLKQDGPILYALAIPTNEEIQEAVRNKQYRFASAEYELNYIDKETGTNHGAVLSAIGLTNEPFLTKLPDTVVLSEQNQDVFYLDYKEVEKSMTEENVNNPFQKLAETLINFFKTADGTPNMALAQTQVKPPLTEEQQTQLAEVPKLTEQLKQTQALLEEQVAKTQEAIIDHKLAELVAQGIPPVMTEKIRPILLAQGVEGKIKLADGTEKPLADVLLETLAALPQDQRVKLSQAGYQSSRKNGLTAKDLYGDIVPGLKD
ncbi:hypothetical protein Sgly_0770 [Syntrophobotulus glycolicus DSM 8271]|uniref:Mu-like prophage I protein n=1 Tax=Syntrophobotulus glycolicus (strain DSM 8271 / FlGlyR) TaxID=645991 RepID=F0T163_SYNGF|nr:hypothetical protein [Syntrophobotulus glycolicus]ADY55127.1 hypothetical protein Sgly_0770 [Syntrophobotulus glycolicus DSM 8271]